MSSSNVGRPRNRPEMELLEDEFEVFIDDRVNKDLDRLPSWVEDRVHSLLLELRMDPVRARPNVDIKPMKGFKNTYRARIGQYRMIYSVDFKECSIRVSSVKHREKVYK